MRFEKQLHFVFQSDILTNVEDMPSIAPKVLYEIGGFRITETMFTAWIVTAALIVFAVVVRVAFIPRWNKDLKHTSAFRLLIESAVGMFSKESNELTEKYSKIIGPLYFGCSAFIMFGVLMELFGLRSPLSDLNCDIVLGGITFIVIQLCGILKRAQAFAPADGDHADNRLRRAFFHGVASFRKYILRLSDNGDSLFVFPVRTAGAARTAVYAVPCVDTGVCFHVPVNELRQ